MSKVFAVALGVLTAIGGFVDVGDLVTSAMVGARFGLSLALVTLLGVVGSCVFSEMSGRVVAVSGRATFDLVRERLGPRFGLVNLVSSMAVTLLTFIAEIGGVALSLELASGVSSYLWIPVVALLAWLVFWRVKFAVMENVLGVMGLALIVFAVALWKLSPEWSSLTHQALTFAKPGTEHWQTYGYFAVALFGTAMTPYEVFFFSSGGIEERWHPEDIPIMRANVFLGFPLGGLLSLAIAGAGAAVLMPAGIEVDNLGQVGLPVAVALGRLGLVIALVGFFAVTFGAACETGLSTGYSIAQYFGWQWGKLVPPLQAARFHAVLLIGCIAAPLVLLTTVDPILVTEFSVIFSAVALPLTYLPILIVANDHTYMDKWRNGRLSNVLGTVFLILVFVAAISAIPLMIWTRMGSA